MDRSELFAAAAHNDVDAIERFLRQPTLEASLSATNDRFRAVYEAAVARNESPFVSRRMEAVDAWFTMPNPEAPGYNEFLLDGPIRRGDVRTVAWFFGSSATELIGDTIRGLLERIYRVMVIIRGLSPEFTEMVLSSPLYCSMSNKDEAFALSMMLDVASGLGRSAAIRLLVAHGANLTTLPSMFGERGNVVATETLLDCGVFAVSHQVLTDTARSRRCDLAEVLIENGMDAQLVGRTNGPLHVAAEQGENELVELLVTRGFADVNAHGDGGLAPLMSTLSQGEVELGVYGKCPPIIVAFLLENGALVDLRDDLGRTALHHAVRCDYTVVIRLLLNYGADVNAQDAQGLTALHTVAQMVYHEDFERLEVLLSHGANPFIQDQDGRTALCLLRETEAGREYIARYVQHFE